MSGMVQAASAEQCGRVGSSVACPDHVRANMHTCVHVNRLKAQLAMDYRDRIATRCPLPTQRPGTNVTVSMRTHAQRGTMTSVYDVITFVLNGIM